MSTFRASVTTTITFGMVTIPVKFYVSAKDESVSFNMISPEGNRVKQKLVDGVSGKEVLPEEVKKGYEFEKGRYVTFTADEIAKLELAGAKTIVIREFIDAEDIDPVQIEKTYYLGPDKGGDKGYALLSDAMKALGKAAIAQWHTKGRAHLVAIRPYKRGLILQILFYANEVRDFDQIEVVAHVISDAERNMAAKLMEAFESDGFEPAAYVDEYASNLMSAVAQKVAGQEITVPADVPQANVLDIFEALKMSIAQAGKKAKAPKGAKSPAKKGNK